MIKKIIIFIMFLTITACGFEPIYTKRSDLNFLVKNIVLEGDKKINKKVISAGNIKKDSASKNTYVLKIDSKKNIKIVAKDASGNTTMYRTVLNIKITIEQQNKKAKTKNFSSGFTYNNLSNKFDLSQYQKSIEQNLINKLIEEINVYLTKHDR